MSAAKRLGFIGAGNMAKAIGFSLLKKEVLKPSQVIVSCPEEHYLTEWKELGCDTTYKNGDVLESSSTVIWATKPQFFVDAVDQVGQLKSSGNATSSLSITIMAGVPLDTFSKTLREKIYKKCSTHNLTGTARVMPNIGVGVGAGCAVYSMENESLPENEQTLVELFSSIGQCHKVPESQINAYCGLFASGIGFMFPILEAMSDGAVQMGIPRDLSLKIAAQTMKGAAELVLSNSQTHPGALKDSVCSPGGTTIAGVAELEKFGIRHALISAIAAATKRGEELGKLSKK